MDDAVSLAPISIFRDDRFEPRRREPPCVEGLLPREGRRHRARLGKAPARDAAGSGVGDAQEWDGNAKHDLLSKLMHGVGGQNDEIRSATLQRFRGAYASPA
jgi:hypothetical protein